MNRTDTTQTTYLGIAQLAQREPITLSEADLKVRIVRLAEDSKTLDLVAQRLSRDLTLTYEQVVDDVMMLATEFRAGGEWDESAVDPTSWALHDRVLAHSRATGRDYGRALDEINERDGR